MSDLRLYRVMRDLEGKHCGNEYLGNLVTCSECKYASDNKVYGCMLNHFNDNDYDYHRMYADDFCSYGEREGE